MSLSLIVVGLSYLAVSGVAAYTYIAWLSKHLRCRITAHVFILGGLLIIPGLMHLIWAASRSPVAGVEITFIRGFFAVLTSIVILLLGYRWTANRYLLYLFGLLSISILAAYYDQSIFFNLLVLSAFLISLIVFLDLYIDTSHHIKQGSVLGALYAATGGILHVAAIAKISFPDIVWAIPHLLLAGAVYMMYLDGKYCALVHPPRVWRGFKSRSTVVKLVFMRYVTYTIAIASLMFISGVSIHELGHAITARMYQCEQSRIIFDLQTLPHTEVVCQVVGPNIAIITIAGLAATTLAGLILLFTREKNAIILGKLLLVYGFLMSAADLRDLNLSEPIISTIMLLGLLALIFAFIDLSRYYLESQHEVLTPEHLKGEKSKSLIKRLQTFI